MEKLELRAMIAKSSVCFFFPEESSLLYYTFYAADFYDKIVCFFLQPYCYISIPGGVIREVNMEGRQKYLYQIISKSITLSTLKKVVNGGRMTYSSS